MINQSRSSIFVAVTCQCGKVLRAKHEMAGSEIRCWDCHQMVLVPFPRQGARVAQELSDGALGVIKGPGFTSIFAAAVLITALMAIPIYGLWCAGIGLILAGFAYAEIIRRISRGPVEEPEPGWARTLLPRSVPVFILSLLMAAGTVIPLWLWKADLHRSPHWDGTGRAIAILAWTVVPLLLWLTNSSDRNGRLGVGRCLKLAARHPLALLLALAVVPASLVIVEAGFGLIFFIIPGNLPFFALDYMPMPQLKEKPVIFQGIPHFLGIDYRSYPQSPFIHAYFDGLRHGYTFAGAIPASLSLPTRAGLSSSAIGLYPPLYGAARVLLSMTVVTCLLTAFAIQARWLGAIPALEKRRPA